LRRILWCIRWVLTGLAERLAQSRSRLQARLPHCEGVFRWIPNEFEEPVVFRFVVDDDGGFVDLATYSNNVAAHDCRRVARGNRSIALVGAYGISGCRGGICAGSRAGRLRPTRTGLAVCERQASSTALTSCTRWRLRSGSAQSICGRARPASLRKLEIWARFQASNQLAGCANVD